MRKTKKKKYLKHGILLIGISFLMTNCETEKIVLPNNSQLNQSATEIDYVNSDVATQAVNAIASLTGESSFKNSNSSKTLNYKKSYIDLNAILKVKNAEGITNYSFNIVVENAPINEFYNVVVRESTNGTVKEPYVIKYVVNQDALAVFLANNKNFRYFKGKKYILSFNHFFDNINGLSNKSSNDLCSDEEVIPIDNTPTGVDGNFYNISGGNFLQTNPNYYNYTSSVVPGNSFLLYLNSFNTTTQTVTSHVATISNTVVPVSVTSAPATIIQVNTPVTIISKVTGSIYLTSVLITTNTSGLTDCFMRTTKTYSNNTSTTETTAIDCLPTTDNPFLDKSSIKSKTATCIDPTGEVGVNLSSSAIATITNCIKDLSLDQFKYINDPLNAIKTAKIKNFLDQNGCNDETSTFVKMAIDAYDNNGGEVDWANRIIDTNLKPCMKSILTNLKFLTKGMSYIITKFKGNEPGYNWILKDGSLFGATGQTSQSYDRITGAVTTTFDSQAWKSATDLSWARTMLHESIHAYIVASFGSDYTLAENTFSDFMNDYIHNKYPTRNDTDHAEFVRNYVNDIAISLEEYGIKNGYNLDIQFYQELAWGGLTHWKKRDSLGNEIKDSLGNFIYEETSWFKISYPNSSDRDRILNIISIELTKKDMNGNTKTQKGNNAGC
jgi:hypothetical protein